MLPYVEREDRYETTGQRRIRIAGTDNFEAIAGADEPRPTAAELADRACDEAYRLAGPGTDEGDILAAMQGVIFSGDGDDDVHGGPTSAPADDPWS